MENQVDLILLLGSNSGDKKAILGNSVLKIQEKLGAVVLRSSLYQSKSWGFSGNDFLNQVVLVSTDKSSFDCLSISQDIEKELGRKKKSIDGVYENRIIDIDILFLSHQIIQTENLVVPHPKIQERMFTLAPLNEILPDFTHPQLNKSIKELLAECQDTSEVIKLNG